MSENQCVLACVTAQKNCARLIHRGCELAKAAKVPLRVLHVNQTGAETAHPDTPEILNELFSLAHECKADMDILYEPNVAAAIARYAQESGAITLVLGPDRSGTSGRVRQLLPEEIATVYC